jgi:hypothetical protein
MSETPYEAFLGSGIGPLPPAFAGVVFGSRLSRWIYLPGKAYALEPTHPVVGWLTLLRPSLGDNASNIVQEY